MTPIEKTFCECGNEKRPESHQCANCARREADDHEANEREQDRHDQEVFL